MRTGHQMHVHTYYSDHYFPEEWLELAEIHRERKAHRLEHGKLVSLKNAFLSRRRVCTSQPSI